MTPDTGSPANGEALTGHNRGAWLPGTKRSEHNPTASQPQGRLFSERSRADALHTAHALNNAAANCRREAIKNPEIGDVLHRVAALYAKQAADWFGRADRAPEAYA